ncbi:MAG: GDP-mannose 4,6-dehydratase [candidate division Zixibacteria bacterium]|nr:GDP-mannose 4,6-dehydratase [candidate division Zixibacteria bacterium]
MSLRGVKVLVTGAGGFIGSHLVERLLQEGAVVSVFLRYNALGHKGWIDTFKNGQLSRLKIFLGDLRDPEAVRKAVKGQSIVFHLGALIAIPYSYINPREFVDTNVVGTANVLNAALEYKTERIVHTSTSEVYGTAQYVPIDESHPLVGQSPYAASKIGADQLALSYYRSFGLPVTVLRPFNTFGPRQSVRAIIPTIIIQALAGKKIKLGSLYPTRDLSFVESTVEGFVRMAQARGVLGKVINVGAGAEISVGELVEEIGSILKKKLVVEKERERVRPAESEVDRLLADTRLAQEVLDWKPKVDFTTGLKKTIDWYKRNRLLFPKEYVV